MDRQVSLRPDEVVQFFPIFRKTVYTSIDCGKGTPCKPKGGAVRVLGPPCPPGRILLMNKIKRAQIGRDSGIGWKLNTPTSFRSEATLEVNDYG